MKTQQTLQRRALQLRLLLESEPDGAAYAAHGGATGGGDGGDGGGGGFTH